MHITRALATLPLLLATTEAFASPNVLLIIADDLGVDKVAAYGEHADTPTTPTLDLLASQGVLYRNAWSHPTCAPARAAILTGRHGFRTGVTHQVGAALDDAEETLAEVLGAAGYATALFGKWHLGEGSGNTPADQGFDYYAGAIRGGVSDYFDWDKVVMDATTSTTSPTTRYATADAVIEARSWLLAQQGPWFATLAFNAPHSPHHVPPVASLSAATQATLQGSEGDACGQGMPDTARTCYDAMVESMDFATGWLLQLMYRRGMLDDTLVIFVGDNGTPGQVILDDGIFDRTHGKGTVYEGGVNVPLMIYGGPATGLRGGTEETTMVQALDLFSTVVDLTGAGATGATDSRSLRGTLDAASAYTPRDALYTELVATSRMFDDDTWALTDGSAKYMYDNGTERCFDLSTDPGESTDLYGTGSAVEATCDSLAAARPCLGDAVDSCPVAP